MRRFLGEAVCAATRLASLPTGKNPWRDVIKRGLTEPRALALTFDDGPSESTPRILDLLDKAGVRATFFQCGSNIRRLPDIAREVHLRGHETGNHTYSHSMLYWRHEAAIRLEIESTQQVAAEFAGVVPTLFRAPFGSRWFGAADVLRDLGLRMVKWSHDSGDWRSDEKTVVERATSRLNGGAILLFHDARELTHNPDVSQSIQAIRTIVPVLLDQGYALTTVTSLLGPRQKF